MVQYIIYIYFAVYSSRSYNVIIYNMVEMPNRNNKNTKHHNTGKVVDVFRSALIMIRPRERKNIKTKNIGLHYNAIYL